MPRPNLSNDIKDQILQELEQAPDDFYFDELLHFVLFLKERYDIEMESDIASAREAISEIERDGSIPLEQVRQQLGA
jgi:hypothetical protein